jgi:sulfur carrier protein ThiS
MVRVTIIHRDSQLEETVALEEESTIEDLLQAYNFSPEKVIVYCNGVECDDFDEELEDGCEYQVANKKASSGC